MKPSMGLDLNAAKNRIEIVVVHIKQLSVVRQSLVKIEPGIAEPLQGRTVTRAMRTDSGPYATRIGMARGPPVKTAGHNQQNRAQPDGNEGVADPQGRRRRHGERSAQSHGAPGRMQAAQLAHRKDGRAHSDGRSHKRIRNDHAADQTHDGRQDISADDSARLGQGTGRQRKYEHG